jgi:uncharacterized protein (TIGR04551 family)
MVIVAAAVAPAVAGATGFTDIGQDIVPSSEPRLKATGSFRLRGEGLDNLDLDRGPTPSGELLFPVPLSDPKGQWLTHADMRLRTDLAAYAPGGWVAVKARLDLLDNVALGSLPTGAPAASTQQQNAVVGVKRGWAEVLTPVGLLTAGRQGAQWGLGMLSNAGDAPDSDGGNGADRVAFLTTLVDHIFAVAFDWDSTGPAAARRDGVRSIDLDPKDDIHTVTFAVLQYRNDAAVLRRTQAGKATLQYGAFVSYRWQDNDVPATYLNVATPVTLDSSQSVARGYWAVAMDGWVKFTRPQLRIEAELAALITHIDHASLIPGVDLAGSVDGRQFGGALESEATFLDDRLGVGLDVGFASGDSAPGFGAFPKAGASSPQKGDLDGPQAVPPYDLRVDNFRFSPDYRIDRILFREIIGTVTDAVYLRPHARYRLVQLGPNAVDVSVAVIASRAVYAESTPGGAAPLGVEVDPTLAYGGKEGFSAALEHAVLFPLSGLDNPQLGLGAKPAQLLRLRLSYAF